MRKEQVDKRFKIDLSQEWDVRYRVMVHWYCLCTSNGNRVTGTSPKLPRSTEPTAVSDARFDVVIEIRPIP